MKKDIKKIIFGLVGAALSFYGNAQCPVINCPSDISVNNDLGNCGSVVTYSLPETMDLCNNVGSVVFNYTGIAQSWTVPTGVTEIQILAKGAQGGGSLGYGGMAEGTLNVTPGEQLYVYVGGQGLVGSAVDGGFNGGGYSGNLPTGMNGASGSGGGASDVRKGGQSLTNRVIVAGGGGGSTDWPNQGAGGLGGGLSGLPGTQGSLAGQGGTQSSGGAGYWDGGTLGVGGPGQNGNPPFGSPGAGGGGGYYGGGGGKRNDPNNGGFPGGGGGGSSYIGGVTNGTTTAGVNSGHGQVTISWGGEPVLTTTLESGLASGAFFPIGTTTQRYLLTNENTGDTVSCSFSVTVADTTAPNVACPADFTVDSDEGVCGALINYLPPIINDNCPSSEVTTLLTSGLGTGSLFPVGLTTESYQFTDASGNISTCSFTITVNNNIDISLESTTGHIITSNESDGSYQWLDCNDDYAIITGATGQSYEALVNGDYAVQITGSNGCVDTSECILINKVGIDKKGQENTVSIFPNPSTGILNINLPQSNKNYTIEMYSMLGELIERFNNLREGATKLDLSENKGLFFIKVLQEGRTITHTKIFIID